MRTEQSLSVGVKFICRRTTSPFYGTGYKCYPLGTLSLPVPVEQRVLLEAVESNWCGSARSLYGSVLSVGAVVEKLSVRYDVVGSARLSVK